MRAPADGRHADAMPRCRYSCTTSADTAGLLRFAGPLRGCVFYLFSGGGNSATARARAGHASLLTPLVCVPTASQAAAHQADHPAAKPLPEIDLDISEDQPVLVVYMDKWIAADALKAHVKALLVAAGATAPEIKGSVIDQLQRTSTRGAVCAVQLPTAALTSALMTDSSWQEPVPCHLLPAGRVWIGVVGEPSGDALLAGATSTAQLHAFGGVGSIDRPHRYLLYQDYCGRIPQSSGHRATALEYHRVQRESVMKAAHPDANPVVEAVDLVPQRGDDDGPATALCFTVSATARLAHPVESTFVVASRSETGKWLPHACTRCRHGVAHVARPSTAWQAFAPSLAPLCS